MLGSVGGSLVSGVKRFDRAVGVVVLGGVVMVWIWWAGSCMCRGAGVGPGFQTTRRQFFVALRTRLAISAKGVLLRALRCDWLVIVSLRWSFWMLYWA